MIPRITIGQALGIRLSRIVRLDIQAMAKPGWNIENKKPPSYEKEIPFA